MMQRPQAWRMQARRQWNKKESRRCPRLRATKEFVTAGLDLNDCLGRVGQLLKDSAEATHALSCGVPDRDSNEVQ